MTTWGDDGWYEFSEEPNVFKASRSVTTTLDLGNASRSSEMATLRSCGEAYGELEG